MKTIQNNTKQFKTIHFIYNLFCLQKKCTFKYLTIYERTLHFKSVFLLILFQILISSNVGSAQTCCLKLETQSEGTLDNELLRIGCEKLSRRFSISKIGSCENPSFYLQLSGLEEVYILESLNAIYIDPITLDEIVVNLNYSTSVVNGFLIIDVQEIFFKHPIQSDYILALFEYKFDMLHGNTQFQNGVPSYFGLVLSEKCDVNDPWVFFDKYGGLNAVGIRVSGNWTELENDPIKFDILRKHGGVYIEDELIIDRDGLTFDGYDFTFAPGAQLILKNGTNSNLFGNSIFSGCSEMYQGTKLESSASAKFEGNMISGAEIGIYADVGSKLILEGNVISQSAIGVKGNSANIQSLENMFTTDANELWLPFFTGQTEFPLANKMNVGILTNNSTMLFDQGSTYSKVWNGVESNSSLIQVVVSNFTEIIPYNNQYQLY